MRLSAAAREGEITPEAIRKHLYMFVQKYFPEMGKEDIKIILKEYESRSRRFGK